MLFRSDIINTSLPLQAYATITNITKIVNAAPMEVSAVLRTNVEIFTTSSDEVVVYLNHVDPILYLREDIIK